MTTAILTQTLPGYVYTDPAIFAKEQEQLFSRMWIYVARPEDLPDAGNFKCINVGGENIILVRGQDQQLRAFYNVCRHRGSRLCTEASGSLSVLRCRYHAWGYGLDGSLISAPNATALTEFDPSQFSLIPLNLEIWQGMVWINLSDHPTPLQEHVRPFILERMGMWEVFAAYPWEQLRTGKKISYTVEANWKLILENFLECYHCTHVHPELCRLLPGFRQGGSYLAGTGVGTQLAEQVEAFSRSGRSHFPIFANLRPEDQRAYYGFVIYPNLMINLLPDQVVIHQAQPLSPIQTRVTCEWLFEDRTVQDPEFDPSDAVAIFDLINRQDWEVCELAQQGVGSRAFSQGGVYLPAESDLALFTQMIRERLQDLDGQAS